ncbi:MAG TPA: cell wall hydrolase [Caulobacteraceae bacterium]|nr:cell wall hydrolase [Caulobacteraceae bacterium]
MAIFDHALLRRVGAGVAAAGLALAVSLGLAGLARPGPSPVHVAPLQITDLSDDALKHELRGMDPAEQALALRLDPVAHRRLRDRPIGWARFDIAGAPGLDLPALTSDDARRVNALIPVSVSAEPSARPFILHASTEDRSRAEQCLTQAIYYEAGFEPAQGRAAVAQIVLNRLRHPAFPKSVCGVVFQGAQLPTGCQFSFTCDGSLNRTPAADAWAQARTIARRALNGYVVPAVGEATHYHADYVLPYWSASLVKITQIGAHIFYRWSGPDGAPSAFAGRYAGGEAQVATVLADAGPQIALNQALATGQERTVTLGAGGEARTYRVADPNAANGVRMRVAGVIYPSRRQPTPEEVARINAALPPLNDNAAPAAAPAPPVAPAPDPQP